MRTRTIATLVLLASLGAMLGCGGKTVYVTRYPDWPYQHYERVAVVPGRPATPEAARDAHYLADQLTNLLRQNGSFEVLSRSELAEITAEQDLSKLADAIDEGTALPAGRIKAAQALVVPRITRYELIRDQQSERVPRYRLDRKGRVILDRKGKPIIDGYDTVITYRHAAEVEGSVRVVDAATSKVLTSHASPPLVARKVRRNRPPSETPEQLAADAVRELATSFYVNIAPVQIEVKVDKDMLIVATDYFDGRYEEAKRISPRREDFMVVVRDLPVECQRNAFRIAVAPEEGRQNLFEEEFVWTAGVGPEGLVFRVPVAPLAATQAQKFVAKLYSAGDPEPKLERSFELDVEERDD